MEFITVAEDKLINADNIISIEKRKGIFKITTSDGRQHNIEKDVGIIMAELNRYGISTPKQFWAG